MIPELIMNDNSLIQMKYIATLLTVHNRKEKTLACLSRLFGQRIPKGHVLDVYLTDDGCTDGTPEAIREQFPSVHIIQGDGNLYWNRGMYVAWETASKAKAYDYYLWLNDDTFVYANMMDVLIEASMSKKDEAIIVGATQNAAHTQITYGGRLNKGLPQPKGQLVEVDHFNGNIVLIPQTVFKKLGNLDWYFTHSKGDFDYGLRAKSQGIKMYQAGEILGECELHERIDKWCNPNVPFKERWKAMWKPNGMLPHETYHLEKRHLGVMAASFHYITIIIRCLFPKLWIE